MKDAKELFIFCDGGARGNPGPAAAACVFKDKAGNPRFLCGKYLGITTNNQAEYAAVKLALEVVKEQFHQTKCIKFFLDSKLVANQLAGLYKVKDASLREIFFQIRELESRLEEVYYQHVSRGENEEADRLVNKAIDQRKDFQQKID